MKFDIKILGIDSLKQKLDKLNKINSNSSFRKRVLNKLAKIGIKEADLIFSKAQYDGTNDVKLLEPKWVNNYTVQIVAQGNAVTFIEFGTGVFYSEQHLKAAEMGAIRGEYGKGKGKQRTWGYYGEPGSNGVIRKTNEKGDLVTTHGNPPAKAMYEASKVIRFKILEIIREELHK